MKKVFVLISAAALVFAACEKEVSEETAVVPDQSQTEEVESVPQEIILKMDATVTKAALSDPEGDQITLNWKEGDVIGIKLSDESVISGTITIDGDIAKVTVDLGGKSISDVWFPYNGGTKPDAVAQYQSYDTINVPLEMSSIVGSTVTLSSIVDWCLVRIPVKNGPVGSVKTIKQIKLKSNVVGRPAYEINKNLTLSTSEVAMFDFVLPADAGAVLEVIVVEGAGIYNKEYRRKRSSSLDLVAGKTYALPTIEVDDTGKHYWDLRSSATNDSEADFPFWFHSNTKSYDDKIDHGPDCMTVTTVEQSNGKYRADIAPILFNSSHVYVCKTRKTVAADGDAERLVIHAGNYPIFAVMMTDPTTIGTARSFILDTNSKIEDGMPEAFSGRIGNGANKQSKLTNDDVADRVIVYYDLSSTTNNQYKIGTKEIPNTRALKFYSWQVQVADVVVDYVVADPDSAPKYKVYWAGTFNSLSDLKNHAGSGWK